MFTDNQEDAGGRVAASPPTSDGEDRDTNEEDISVVTQPLAPSGNGIGCNVGVHIERSAVRLAKNRHGRLVDYRCVHFDPDLKKNSDEFEKFVRKVIKDFCRGAGRVNIWACRASPTMHVRHLRLPRVSPRQLSNTVYWTFRNEIPFDERATVFDYEVEGEITEAGVRKTDITAYISSRQHLKETADLFAHTGHNLAGVTIPFFAFRNLFKSPCGLPGHTNLLCLHVGDDYSQIAVFLDGNVALARGIKIGVMTLFDPVRDALKTSLGADQCWTLLRSLNPESEPLTEKDVGYGIDPEALLRMMQPALMRLVRQLERSIESYLGARDGGPRIERIYISGAISVCKPMMEFIAEQLGVTAHTIDPMAAHCAAGKLQPPENETESVLYAPAIGLSMSTPATTPNLLYTYKDKERARHTRRLNVWILGAFLCLTVGLVGAYLWSRQSAARQRPVLENLEQAVAAYDPQPDESMILALAVQTRSHYNRNLRAASEYLALATLSELTHLTVAPVKLTSIQLDFGPIPPLETEEEEAPPDHLDEPKRHITLNGVVSGKRQMVDTLLTEYVLRLESSPLFGQVTVTSSETTLRGDALLSFALDVLMVEEEGEEL